MNKFNVVGVFLKYVYNLVFGEGGQELEIGMIIVVVFGEVGYGLRIVELCGCYVVGCGGLVLFVEGFELDLLGFVVELGFFSGCYVVG